MQIVKFPHPSLSTPSTPVTVFGPELKTILEHMWETMIANSGMGLAANQVEIPYSMFTMIGPEEEKLYLVNPKIKSKSVAPSNLEEGCLSAPGEFLVRSDRALWVEVEFQDSEGNDHRRIFKGIQAVCVQHELEHLAGISFMESTSLPKKKRIELSKKWGL